MFTVTPSLMLPITLLSFAGAASARFPLTARQDAGTDYVPTGPFLGDFPDPGVINVNGTWYAYSTETIDPQVNIPIAQSTDFRTWTRTENNGAEVDALPTLPEWVNMTSSMESSETWAPDVAEWRPGVFTMLYSAVPTTSYNQHCIGLAQADSPLGPFISYSATPLICPLSQGGAIDASHFKDPVTGNFYVVYKIDGGSGFPTQSGSLCANNVNTTNATPLMLQQIGDPQYFDFVGDPITLLDNNGPADEGDVEAPSMIYIPPPGNGGNSKRQEETTVWSTVYTTDCPESSSQPAPGGSAPATSSSSAGPSPSGSAPSSSATSAPSSSASSSGSSSTSSSSAAPSPSSNANGTYLLFFSPGCFADTSYAVSYAVSSSGVAGPYTRHDGNLLMTGDGGLRSPGGMTVVGTDPVLREADDQGMFMAVYHAGIPVPNGTRDLYVTDLRWDGTQVGLLPP